jgi:hypothetical protein
MPRVNCLNALHQDIRQHFVFRYSTVRPLSTLNYTTDMFNNSSIVSGIEFDKVRFFEVP